MIARCARNYMQVEAFKAFVLNNKPLIEVKREPVDKLGTGSHRYPCVLVPRLLVARLSLEEKNGQYPNCCCGITVTFMYVVTQHYCNSGAQDPPRIKIQLDHERTHKTLVLREKPTQNPQPPI